MLPQLSLLYLKPRHEVTVEVLRKYDLTVEVSARQITEIPPEMADYVTSVHMPYSTHELGRLNYAAVDDDFRELSLQMIEEAMRQAARLYPDAGIAVIHGAPERFAWEAQPAGQFGDYDLYIGSLRRLADTAADNGFRLMLENNRRYWTNAEGEMAWEDAAPAANLIYFAIEPADWLQSWHDVAHENLKLCLDTAHACCTVHAVADHEQRVAELMRFLDEPEALGHIHWNDHELFEPEGRLDKHLNIGKGTIPPKIHRRIKYLDASHLLEHYHGEDALVEELAYIESL